MASDQNDSPIGVFGATGQQGSSIVAALRRRGLPVRALVRDLTGDRAAALRKLGADTVHADITEPASVTDALDGVGTFVFMTSMDGAGVGSEELQGKALVDAARSAGVPRLIYNSGGASERPTGVPHFESKGIVERYIRELGLDCVFVRPVFFMDNFAGQFLSSQGDELLLSMPLPPGVPLQMVAVKDIGVMTAAVVADPGNFTDGAVEFAGDELTGEDMARALGDHFGRPVRFVSLPLSVFDDLFDMRQMFSWFSTLPAYQADFARARRHIPGLSTFRDWLRQTDFQTPQS